jgi:hypothetical protein
VPQQFAYRGSPARHSVRKPEIVDCLKFFGRKHDLQSLFAHETDSSVPVPHG